MTRILGILVLAVLLGACGGSDDSGSSSQSDGTADDDYVEAVTESLGEGSSPLTDEQLTCMAKGAIDAMGGADALREAGVSPQDFVDAESFTSAGVDVPADAAERYAASMSECGVIPAMESGVLNGLAEDLGAEIPPDGKACLSEHVDDERLGNTMAGLIFSVNEDGALASDAGLETIQAIVIDALVACPSVMRAVLMPDAPPALSPEEETCVTGFATAHRDVIARIFPLYGESPEVVQEAAAQLASACPSSGA